MKQLQTAALYLHPVARLRIAQVRHLYADTGLAYTMIIAFLAAGAFAWAFNIAASDGYARFAPLAIFALIILSIQNNRKDRHFLTTQFGGYRSIFIAEYLSISLPITLLYLAARQWVPAACLLASAALASFIPKLEIKRSLLSPLWDRLPAQAYEIKSFMRKGGIIFLLLWVIMISLPQYPATVPVCLALGSLIAMSSYEWGEPVPVLRSAQRGANAFLQMRFMLAAKLFLLWATLPSVLFIVFNVHYWYIIPAILALICIVLWYSISVKYAFYRPNEKLNARLFVAIGPMSIIIPVLLPLALLLAPYFYRKAIANLNPFLHDFDTVA